MTINEIENNFRNKPLTPSANVNQSSESSEQVSVFNVNAPLENSAPSAKTNSTEKQLDVIYKNALKKLDHIPPPFSFLGADKIKKDTLKIIDNAEFRAGAIKILEDAKAKDPKNADKNVIELIRDKDTFKTLFEYIKKSSQNSGLLNMILSNKAAESKLYDYLSSDKALVFLKDA